MDNLESHQKPPAPWELTFRWALVGLFFALVVGMTLAGREVRQDRAVPGPTTQDITEMEMAFHLQSLTLLAPGAAAQADTTTFTQVANRLGPKATKDYRAAMLVAVAKSELGQPVPANVLTKLRESKSDAYRAAASVFAAKTLSKQRASELAGKVEGVPGVGPMVAMQAYEKAGDNKAVNRYFPPGPMILISVAMLGLCGLGLVGVVLWLLYFSQRGKPSWQPLGHPFQNMSGDQASKMALLAVGWIGMFIVIGVVGSVALEPLPEFVGMILTTTLFLTLMAVSMMFIRMNGQTLMRQMNQSDYSIGKQFALGLAGWVANIPVLAIMLIALLPILRQTDAAHPVSEMMAGSEGYGMVIAIFFAATISAPLWEEVAFRGALFGGLSRAMRGKVGMVAAVVLSSLAFAAIHPQGPAAWLMLGWIGAMGCILTHHTRSIIPAIVMHAVHNATLVALSLVILR